MMGIPRPALLLGLAGVIPLALPMAPMGAVEPELSRLVQLAYAVTILAFMSGCIWAFAVGTKDTVGYAISVIPALFGFGAMVAVVAQIISVQTAQIYLALGFIALLGLDKRAVRLAQAPPWWMRLRLILTNLVVALLLIGLVL